MPRKANTDNFPPCGKCGADGSQQRRNGRQAGRQRFQCLSCRKTWTHNSQIEVEPLDQDDEQDSDDFEFNPEAFLMLAEYYATPEGKKAMKAMGF